MNRLVSIIGLAPSEMPFSDLIAKLEKERNRVRAALETFRNQPLKATRTTKSKPIPLSKQIKRMIADGLITEEEVLMIIGGGG